MMEVNEMETKNLIKKYKEEEKKINFNIPWKLVPIHRKIIFAIISIELIFLLLACIMSLYRINLNTALYIIFRSIWLLIQFISLSYFLKEGKIKKLVKQGFSIIFIVFIIECFFSFTLYSFIFYTLIEITLWNRILFYVENTEENKKVMDFYKIRNLYKKLELLNKLGVGKTYREIEALIKNIKENKISFYNLIFVEIKEFFKILFFSPISTILAIVFSYIFTEIFLKKLDLLILGYLTTIFIMVSVIIWNIFRAINKVFFSQNNIISDLEEIANLYKKCQGKETSS